MKEQDFVITANQLICGKDEYPLCKIRNARVFQNSFWSYALRTAIYSLLFSSIVWAICPETLAQILAPIALIIGIVYGFATNRKFELQVEIEHSDETGHQWIAVAKSSRVSTLQAFERAAMNLNHTLQQAR